MFVRNWSILVWSETDTENMDERFLMIRCCERLYIGISVGYVQTCDC